MTVLVGVAALAVVTVLAGVVAVAVANDNDKVVDSKVDSCVLAAVKCKSHNFCGRDSFCHTWYL